MQKYIQFPILISHFPFPIPRLSNILDFPKETHSNTVHLVAQCCSNVMSVKNYDYSFSSYALAIIKRLLLFALFIFCK